MSKKTIEQKLEKKYHKAYEIEDLKDMLYKACERYSKRTAFKLKNEKDEIYKVTYSAFQNDVKSLGTSLINLGLAGSSICVIGKNSYKWAVSYLASCIVGTVVPIDKELHVDDVTNFMNVSEAKAILGDAKYIEDIISHKENLTNPNTLFVCFDLDKDTSSSMSFELLLDSGKNLMENGNTSFRDIKIDPNALHILLFTSRYNRKCKRSLLIS